MENHSHPLQRQDKDAMSDAEHADHPLQQSVAGASMPPPPFQLQSSNAIQRKDSESDDSDEKSSANGKRKREPESEQSAVQKLASPVQRAVAQDVQMDTRMVIVRRSASDYGDTGHIRRPSNNVADCMAVEFENEPNVLYRVLLNEMDTADVTPALADDAPGAIRGGAGTTRLNVAAFWPIWMASQRDNTHDPQVAKKVVIFRDGGDVPPPMLQNADWGEDGFRIRTLDGRHRIAAARMLGYAHIYIETPSENIQQMAEIAGLKASLFPDL